MPSFFNSSSALSRLFSVMPLITSSTLTCITRCVPPLRSRPRLMFSERFCLSFEGLKKSLAVRLYSLGLFQGPNIMTRHSAVTTAIMMPRKRRSLLIIYLLLLFNRRVLQPGDRRAGDLDSDDGVF